MKKIRSYFLHLLVLLFTSFHLVLAGGTCKSVFDKNQQGKNPKAGEIAKSQENINSFDTLLLPSDVLIYDGEKFVVEKNKAVGILDGKIVFVGERTSSLTAKKTYRLDHHLLSPGLVNAHTHLPMSLFKGLVDNLPLKVWLEDYIFPLEGELVNEESIRIGTRLAALELIKGGVTTFADMYFYNSIMAQALDQAGLRGIVGIGIPSVEKDWKDWKNKFLKLREQYKDHSKIAFALAPHAPYTVSTEDLRSIAEFSKKEKAPVFIHVSESQWEIDEIQKRHGKTPVQYLHDLGLTGIHSVFIHSVHINEVDRKILAETGTSTVYNPESNMKVVAGISPVVDLLKEKVAVGLGTDGSGSNNNLNMFEEMGSAARLQALKYGGVDFTAMDAFKMATILGAKALGLEEKIGTIEVGKLADLIAIDIRRAEYMPPYNLISHAVYSDNGAGVVFVMTEGDVLMEDRQVKTLNEEEIYKESSEIGQKIEKFIESFKANKNKE